MELGLKSLSLNETRSLRDVMKCKC